MKKIFIFLLIYSFFGCKKLDLKPDNRIVIPKTSKDIELLLDNADVMNNTPALPQVSADEYFLTSFQDWQAIYSTTAKNASIWQKEIYSGDNNIEDWNLPYSSIFICNSVLDLIDKQNIKNDPEKKKLKGWALFARSYAFFNLVSTFAKAYDNITASTDLGIPLKLNSGIDEIVQRSSLQASYDQIIKDAIESSELLQPDIIPSKRNRPSKVAAFSLLARIYLSMRQYDKAEIYVDKALELYSKLTDFTLLSKTERTAFSYDTEEVIYFTQQATSMSYELAAMSSSNGNAYGVDPDLIALYDQYDLRLPIYFRKNSMDNYNLKPINTFAVSPFSGLATDEMYLIKAECLARRNEVSESMDILNNLLITRWDTNEKPFQKTTASNPETALDKILIERRKALVWRGIRWLDLKRLNLEGRNITITRSLNGQIFKLDPQSPKYVLPIPDDEISLSGIQQNKR